MSHGFSNARVSEPSDTLSWCTKFTRIERKDAHDSPKPNSGTHIWLPPEPLPRSQDHPGQTPTNRNPARSQQCWATVLAAGFPYQLSRKIIRSGDERRVPAAWAAVVEMVPPREIHSTAISRKRATNFLRALAGISAPEDQAVRPAKSRLVIRLEQRRRCSKC